MRKLLVLASMLASNSMLADTVQKWTDHSGRVHYSYGTPPSDAIEKQQVDIQNTFDPAAYEQAKKRNGQLNKEIQKIERREKAAEKAAEKRLDEYFDHLDRKNRERERIKSRNKKSRATQRNHSSIKLKRAEKKEKPARNQSPLSFK